MKGIIIDFIEKARIRIEYRIKHNADHTKEYEVFADQMETTEK